MGEGEGEEGLSLMRDPSLPRFVFPVSLVVVAAVGDGCHAGVRRAYLERTQTARGAYVLVGILIEGFCKNEDFAGFDVFLDFKDFRNV